MQWILLDIGMTSNPFASSVRISLSDAVPFDGMVEMLDGVEVLWGHRCALVRGLVRRLVVVMPV